jgi:hypothetical protein
MKAVFGSDRTIRYNDPPRFSPLGTAQFRVPASEFPILIFGSPSGFDVHGILRVFV